MSKKKIHEQEREQALRDHQIGLSYLYFSYSDFTSLSQH